MTLSRPALPVRPVRPASRSVRAATLDRRDYGAPRPLFGPQARRDTTYALWTTLSNRNIDIGGFTPQLTLRHERRDSNITLHDYRRNVIELGVVRSF
ncbi:surface lipoprotein assembly modifier [Hoeflea sp.]|uniref:surface lipoprotein assembly modifier n=1 Tax=Hoeflea sp. TaxID=1940281 RepID=UPI0010AAD617